MHIIINEHIYTDATNVVVRLITPSTGPTSIQVFFNDNDSLLITDASKVTSIDGVAVSLGMSALATALQTATEFTFYNNETNTSIGEILHASTVDTAPLDTDEIYSYRTGLLRTTWLKVKAFLKTYFDTLYVVQNSSITGATKTKITYDAKGLVTSGADATTADIADSTNKRYVTDAQLTVIGNTSGTNSGNETATTIGTLINGAASATPNDTDTVATAESTTLKKITWANVKAFLKTYFDTLYGNISDAIYTVVLGADVATTSTTFVDVSTSGGALKFPVISGGVYWFRFTIIFTTGTTGRGSGWAINGPTLSSTQHRAEWSLTTTSRTIADGLAAYDATTANATCASTTANVAIIEGILKVSASGDVIARMLSANSGNTITAKQYSTVQYKKLN